MVSDYYTPQSLIQILQDSNYWAAPYALEVSFGKRLAEARNAIGLSQEALGRAVAEKLGEAPSEKSKKQGISHWEKDRFQPNLEQLGALCEVLGCTADYLLLGKTPENLPIEAINEARFFNRLSPAGKRKWKTLRPVFVDAVPDKAVEEAMPVTGQPKE